MALSLAKSPYARQEAPLCLPQQWEPILPPTSAVGTLSSSGRAGSAVSLCRLPSPWAAPLLRLALPRFWLPGSAHASGICLIPEFQSSLFHSAALSWSLQARRGQRVQAGEGGCQAFCTGRCILSALTPKLFCFFSLSPASFLSLSFPSCFLSLFCSYESSAEILPHTPRLTHFPTVSGSPASLADSMQQKLSCPRRRRQQSPSAM